MSQNSKLKVKLKEIREKNVRYDFFNKITENKNYTVSFLFIVIKLN